MCNANKPQKIYTKYCLYPYHFPRCIEAQTSTSLMENNLEYTTWCDKAFLPSAISSTHASKIYVVKENNFKFLADFSFSFCQ